MSEQSENSDVLMDARLHAAGQRWRDANVGSPAAPDAQVFALAPAGVRGPRRRWTVLASAAAVVVVIAGGASWIATRGGGGDRSPSTSTGLGKATATPASSGIVAHVGTRTYVLANVTYKDVTVASPPGITLRFSGTGNKESVTGSDGVNSFSGPLRTATASSLSFGPIAETEIGAADEPAALPTVQAAISAMLAGSNSWQLLGAKLVITPAQPAGTSLIYLAQPSPAVTAVDGTWQLSGYGRSGGGASSLVTQTGGYSDWLVIDGSRATISTRCYRESAAVTTTPTAIRFTQVRVVYSVPCTAPADAETAADDAVGAALSASARWTRDGSTLTMTGDDTTLAYTPVAKAGGPS